MFPCVAMPMAATIFSREMVAVLAPARDDGGRRDAVAAQCWVSEVRLSGEGVVARLGASSKRVGNKRTGIFLDLDR